jgi:ketosteroid isomerase-like protein
MTAPQQVFQHALRLVQERDLEAYVELFADDGMLEFPFAPPGAPRRMQGRKQIRRSLEPLWRQARQRGRRIAGYDPVVVHQTLDPEVIIAEFTLRGVLQGRGTPIGCRTCTCTGCAMAGSCRSATTGTPWPSPGPRRPPRA